jgi:hypothetical protein
MRIAGGAFSTFALALALACGPLPTAEEESIHGSAEQLGGSEKPGASSGAGASSGSKTGSNDPIASLTSRVGLRQDLGNYRHYLQDDRPALAEHNFRWSRFYLTRIWNELHRMPLAERETFAQRLADLIKKDALQLLWTANLAALVIEMLPARFQLSTDAKAKQTASAGLASHALKVAVTKIATKNKATWSKVARVFEGKGLWLAKNDHSLVYASFGCTTIGQKTNCKSAFAMGFENAFWPDGVIGRFPQALAERLGSRFLDARGAICDPALLGGKYSSKLSPEPLFLGARPSIMTTRISPQGVVSNLVLSNKTRINGMGSQDLAQDYCDRMGKKKKDKDVCEDKEGQKKGNDSPVTLGSLLGKITGTKTNCSTDPSDELHRRQADALSQNKGVELWYCAKAPKQNDCEVESGATGIGVDPRVAGDYDITPGTGTRSPKGGPKPAEIPPIKTGGGKPKSSTPAPDGSGGGTTGPGSTAPGHDCFLPNGLLGQKVLPQLGLKLAPQGGKPAGGGGKKPAAEGGKPAAGGGKTGAPAVKPGKGPTKPGVGGGGGAPGGGLDPLINPSDNGPSCLDVMPAIDRAVAKCDATTNPGSGDGGFSGCAIDFSMKNPLAGAGSGQPKPIDPADEGGSGGLPGTAGGPATGGDPVNPQSTSVPVIFQQ